MRMGVKVREKRGKLHLDIYHGGKWDIQDPIAGRKKTCHVP
jgi:hypothetical protein